MEGDLSMLRGKHIINGSDTLVLVFQNAAKPLNDAIPDIYNGKIEQSEVAEMHERYTWMKFAERVPKADYFFIKDHFSSVYGWYLMDNGQFIHHEFNNALTDFIKENNYKRVVSFGSSKGGTAALLYGMMNPCITDVFSLIPQIHVATFINNLCPKEKSLFFGQNKKFEKQVDNILFEENLYETFVEKRIYFYSGILDIQFDPLLQYRDFLEARGIQTELFLNRSDERHTRLVNQYAPFIYGILEDLIDQSRKRTNLQAISVGSSVNLLREQ